MLKLPRLRPPASALPPFFLPRYDIDPRNLVISCVDNVKAEHRPSSARPPDGGDDAAAGSPEGESVDMFVGLSCLHIACVFDQEQVSWMDRKRGKSSLARGIKIVDKGRVYGLTLSELERYLQ